MLDDLLIYLLVLVAVIAGWAYGRLGRRGGFGAGDRTREIFDEYFVGLNYLLNDEPDEAIDTFIKALEVNSDTIETHLALGALLRRRGKVDKAIKVHQTLLARPGLDQNFTDSTRLQLAIDYIAAGLLDRAERLLQEILDEDTPAKWDALSHLITIFQTEKEWENAIECARQLLKSPGLKKAQSVKAAAANFCCEQAEVSVKQEQFGRARDEARRAFEFDRRNVRAGLLLGHIEQRLGNHRAAIRELERVYKQAPEFSSELLEPLAESYSALGESEEFEALLRRALTQDTDIALVLSLGTIIEEREGAGVAAEFLQEKLNSEPSLTGLAELLRLRVPNMDKAMSHNLNILQKLLKDALRRKAGYRCSDCGFESRSLYWLCPSCQKWDQIRPIREPGSL